MGGGGMGEHKKGQLHKYKREKGYNTEWHKGDAQGKKSIHKIIQKAKKNYSRQMYTTCISIMETYRKGHKYKRRIILKQWLSYI